MFVSLKNANNRLSMLVSVVAIPIVVAAIIYVANMLGAWVRSFSWEDAYKVFFLTLTIWLIIVSAQYSLRPLIQHVYQSLYVVVFERGVQAVRARRLRIAWVMVRVQRYVFRIYYLLLPRPLFRIYWVAEVWGGFYHLSFVRILRQVVASLCRWPAIIAALTSIALVYSVDVRVFDRYSNFSDLLNSEMGPPSVFGRFFLSVPVIVASFALIPIVFAFYFYGQKRDARKIVEDRHRQKFVDVICLYDRLYLWIVDNFGSLVSCLTILINNQNVIVDDSLGKWSMHGDYYRKNPLLSDTLYGLAFNRHVDVSELEIIFRLLGGKELVRYSDKFASTNFDLARLYANDIFVQNQLESLDERLFTRRGFEMRFSEYLRQGQVADADLKQCIADNFARDLYSCMLLIYRLKRAWDWLDGYLYSSRAEKVMLKAFAKQEQ